MMKRKIPFYAGTVWEIFRFSFIFLLVSLMMNPPGNPVTNLLLLWIAAGQILGAVLFFLTGYLPERSDFLRPVLILYKLISLLPGLILVLLGILLPGRTTVGWAAPTAIAAVDSLFLFFLILFFPSEGRGEEN